MAVNGGDGAPETQTAGGHGLVVDFKTEFLLSTQRDMLEGDAIGLACDIGTHVKSADFHVLDHERTHGLGVSHVDAVHAGTVVGIDLDVLDGALLVSEETDADGTGVPLTGTDGHVADGVAASGFRAHAGVDHGARGVRIVKAFAVVVQLQDGSAHALSLENGTVVGVGGLVRLRPDKTPGNPVDTVGEVDDVVAVGMVVQGLLDGLRIVGLAIALGLVGRFGDVNYRGTYGKFHLR